MGDLIEGKHPPEIREDDLPPAWTEWGYVMRRVRDGRHPSDAHLRRLVEQEGVPDSARKYVASRFGSGPGAKPFVEPDDWGLFGAFRAEKAMAYMDLVHLRVELKRFETAEGGPARRQVRVEALDKTVEVVLRKVKARGTWVVKEPTNQARSLVASHWHMAPDTLKDFEREFRESDAWLGQIF